jgi:pyridoxamine 5'-phosphate oxidase
VKAAGDPIAEIRGARARARRRGDLLADVCYLVTRGARGEPHARALSLRAIDSGGLGLLINRTSPKWRQITASGRVLLLFYWPTVRRQYRIRGRLRPMDEDEVAHLWALKSHGSMLLEHYYERFHRQSRPIPSRATLLEGIGELRRRYPRRSAVPIPPNLVGVRLVPTEIETWHGSPRDRLHVRRLYRRAGPGWRFATLVP